MRLIECFAGWDLLQDGSAAIDVPRLSVVLQGGTAAHRRTRDAIVEAVAAAVSSVTAVLNPSGVVLGGPWSTVGAFAERLDQRLQQVAVVHTELRPAALAEDGPLIGARLAAVEAAQQSLIATSGGGLVASG